MTMCRQLDILGSERNVEMDDPTHAPSAYANTFVDMPVGAMTFVECLDGDEWICWDVERLEDRLGARAYWTRRTTPENARAEMARWQAAVT